MRLVFTDLNFDPTEIKLSFEGLTFVLPLISSTLFPLFGTLLAVKTKTGLIMEIIYYI